MENDTIFNNPELARSVLNNQLFGTFILYVLNYEKIALV